MEQLRLPKANLFKQGIHLFPKGGGVEEGAVLFKGIQLAVQLSECLERILIAQPDISAGKLPFKIEEGAQRPQTADDDDLLGIALVVPACHLSCVILNLAADPDRFQIDCNNALGAHLQRQIDWHIIVVAPVDIFMSVDFLCLKCREAGRGCQQILVEHPFWDILLLHLQGLEGRILHRHQRKVNIGAAKARLVHQRIDEMLQRRNIRSTLSQCLPRKDAGKLAVAQVGLVLEHISHHILEGEIFPNRERAVKVLLDHERTVERTHRGAGHQLIINSKLPHGFPCANLICSARAAARQHHCCFFHLISPLLGILSICLLAVVFLFIMPFPCMINHRFHTNRFPAVWCAVALRLWLLRRAFALALSGLSARPADSKQTVPLFH